MTVSGLVTVSLLKPSGQVLTSTESLCRLRGRVALADIAFTGGGNIVVAAADGSSASPVKFYKVCVSVVSEKCRIDTEILPSLFMRCTTDPNRKDRFPAITHLKFLARDMSEQVSSASHVLSWGQNLTDLVEVGKAPAGSPASTCIPGLVAPSSILELAVPPILLPSHPPILPSMAKPGLKDSRKPPLLSPNYQRRWPVWGHVLS